MSLSSSEGFSQTSKRIHHNAYVYIDRLVVKIRRSLGEASEISHVETTTPSSVRVQDGYLRPENRSANKESSVPAFSAANNTHTPQYARTSIIKEEVEFVDFKYNSLKNEGFVAVRINGGMDVARQKAILKIGEICSSKNIAHIAGEEDTFTKGRYKILDEELKYGILTITFQALY